MITNISEYGAPAVINVNPYNDFNSPEYDDGGEKIRIIDSRNTWNRNITIYTLKELGFHDYAILLYCEKEANILDIKRYNFDVISKSSYTLLNMQMEQIKVSQNYGNNMFLIAILSILATIILGVFNITEKSYIIKIINTRHYSVLYPGNHRFQDYFGCHSI